MKKQVTHYRYHKNICPYQYFSPGHLQPQYTTEKENVTCKWCHKELFGEGKENYRTLLSGRTVSNEDKEHHMTISSKCSKKWLFVDMEDGNIWKRDLMNDKWQHISKTECKELSDIIKKISRRI